MAWRLIEEPRFERFEDIFDESLDMGRAPTRSEIIDEIERDYRKFGSGIADAIMENRFGNVD